MNPILDAFAVYFSRRAVATVGDSQLDRCVALHQRLDWGYADDRTCVANDASLQRGSGSLVSLFHTLRGHRVVVTSDLDRELTLVRLADEG